MNDSASRVPGGIFLPTVVTNGRRGLFPSLYAWNDKRTDGLACAILVRDPATRLQPGRGNPRRPARGRLRPSDGETNGPRQQGAPGRTGTRPLPKNAPPRVVAPGATRSPLTASRQLVAAEHSILESGDSHAGKAADILFQ